MNKTKFFYIFTFLLALIFAFLIGGTMPYLLLYIVVLSFLIPLLHLLISFLGLKAELNLDKNKIFAGENVDLRYSITNKNIFTIPILSLCLDLDREWEDKNIPLKKLSLNPFEKRNFHREIPLKRRGYYESMDFKVNLSDIYGLFTIKKKVPNQLDLTVYPNIIELHSFPISTDSSFGNIAVSESVFQDRASISSLENYEEGDSISQIHWKISAKRDLPIIKKFQNISNASVNIFMESNRSSYGSDIDFRLEDKLVDTSLALVNYFLNLDLDLSLNTFSRNEIVRLTKKTKDDLRLFLEFFARFKANGSKNIVNLLEDNFYSFKQNSIIIVLSPLLDKGLGQIILKLKMKNLTPILILLTDKEKANSSIDKTIKARLIEEDIEIYFIDHGSNIKEVLEIKNE